MTYRSLFKRSDLKILVLNVVLWDRFYVCDSTTFGVYYGDSPSTVVVGVVDLVVYRTRTRESIEYRMGFGWYTRD